MYPESIWKLTDILLREIKLFFDIKKNLEIGTNLNKNPATLKNLLGTRFPYFFHL